MRDKEFKIFNDHLAMVLHKVESFSAIAAFSLRNGGQSPPPLDSLNFSTLKGDSLENVRSNFELLAAHLNIDSNRIATCSQVHGDTVEVISSVPNSLLRADALVAAVPGIFPAIKTADCLPILLIDPVRKISAAVHAGWRGSVLRITRKVVQLMVKWFGTEASDLIAALGPAIGPCCYEVDDTVLIPLRYGLPSSERFVTINFSSTSDSIDTKKSHRLDIVGLNRFELISLGIPEGNIYSTGLCTSCRPDLFFSHRRDGILSGRHIAITGFKD